MEHAAHNPDSPIVFDKELNEFNFECALPGHEHKSQLRIYHCPFCGGAAPKSLRPTLFAIVSQEEQQRLRDLLKEAHTIDDVIRLLGAPEQDYPDGVQTQIPEGEGRPPSWQSFRSIIYTELSRTADVRITDYPGRRVGISINGKHLGSPSRD
jgi:hypothetical protein